MLMSSQRLKSEAKTYWALEIIITKNRNLNLWSEILSKNISKNNPF
jgi:hypothetical protein